MLVTGLLSINMWVKLGLWLSALKTVSPLISCSTCYISVCVSLIPLMPLGLGLPGQAGLGKWCPYIGAQIQVEGSREQWLENVELAGGHLSSGARHKHVCMCTHTHHLLRAHIVVHSPHLHPHLQTEMPKHIWTHVHMQTNTLGPQNMHVLILKQHTYTLINVHTNTPALTLPFTQMCMRLHTTEITHMVSVLHQWTSVSSECVAS